MANSKIDGLLCESQFVNVTTGGVSDESFEEDYSFKWKIKNFLAIKASSHLISEQRFRFKAGKSHGCTSEWSCFLKEVQQNNTIRIYLGFDKEPPNCSFIVNYSFQTIKPNGEAVETRSNSAERVEFYEGLSQWGCAIPVNVNKLKELIWEDGSIVIGVNVKMLVFKSAEQPGALDVQQEVNCFEKEELQKLSNSMTRMIEMDSQPEVVKIIKVVSNDGVEFYANTAVLAARSPVFMVMFESGNWKEGQDSVGGGGSLVLEDLSGKTVKVLLHYLIGGVLIKDDWKVEDVILELTYAADKYQLEGLTKFLDKVLPAIPFGTEILAKLALLTKRLGMKNAEKGLFAKLKETAVDIEHLMFD